MKSLKVLFAVALAATAFSAKGQDLSDPRYASWGDTPEERRENMVNSSFLKEELQNKNFNAAAGYLQKLLDKAPAGSENIYVNGITLYKNKINRAQSLAERNGYIDSLMLLYDLRLQHFGSHATRGRTYILERKAREYLTYRDSDREGVRNLFEEAIAAQTESNGKADAEFVAIYFKNLCDDYKNDEVDAMMIVNTYDALGVHFENLAADKEDFKKQYEACFAASGAASCENIEAIFAKKLADAPDDEVLLAQAMTLLDRANCSSDFFLEIGERYYSLRPTSEVAMRLAQVFQNRQNFSKANEYLREALAKETVDAEREKLLVRIGILEMTGKNYREALNAFRQAQNINPENGFTYYFIGQCYVAGAGACQGLAHDAVYWVAYDQMQRAIPLLENDPDATAREQAANARTLANSYRAVFPKMEDCFFEELKEGDNYTVNCGLVSGISTRVRYRAQ